MFNTIAKVGLIATSGAMFLNPAGLKNNLKEETKEPEKEILVCKYEAVRKDTTNTVENFNIKVETPKLISNNANNTVEVFQNDEKEVVTSKEEETKDGVVLDIPIAKATSKESLKINDEASSVTKDTSSNTEEMNAMIAKIEAAVKKTQDADSAYYIKELKGIYNIYEEVKYSKSQNRRLYKGQNVEEYIEGQANNYPPTKSIGRVSSYYAQTRWAKEEGSSNWVKKSPLITYFGISDLGFLKNIKSVELKGTRPFDYYVVTLSQADASKAAIDYLNAGYYLTNGLFKTDVTLSIQIDKEGYIRTVDYSWTPEVLNTSAYGTISLKLRMGDFNKTVVNKPSDLKENPDVRQKPSDELTETQKLNLKNKIYDAFTKTYNVNSATYETKGTTVKYDRAKNVAIYTNAKETTYYEGKAGEYLNYYYATPDHCHLNWTKVADSSVWKQNPTKQKIFTSEELRFIDHSIIVINDILKVETNNDITTYTVKILKAGANSAYASAYGVKNKFTNDITITVSLDKEGYVTRLTGDFEDNKLDLKLSDFNKTNVEKPEGLTD